jgi:hypothetical protein
LEFEKLNYNHTWIILNGYKGNKHQIDFFEKRNYYCARADEIKKRIFNFRISLLIKTLNNYFFLNQMKDKKFYLNDFKSQIINYALRSGLPINILHNELLENSSLKFHDMQILIDVLNLHNITNIIEHNMTSNTFIYIVGLYANLYKKNILYHIISPLINLNEYAQAFNLSVKILYEHKTNTDTKTNTNTLLIITKYTKSLDNKQPQLIEFNYVLTTKKISKTLSIDLTHKIIIMGKEFCVLKKN